MCVDCKELLEGALQFRKLCAESDRMMRKMQSENIRQAAEMKERQHLRNNEKHNDIVGMSMEANPESSSDSELDPADYLR